MLTIDKGLWTYLRWNSYLSERYKLLYVSTPKAACTSLKWWFADLEGCSDAIRRSSGSNESDLDLMIHDTFHRVAPHVTGLRPKQLSNSLVSDSYFRFAVVRNPYKRIFSAWQSKLLLQEPFQIGPYVNEGFFKKDIETLEDIGLAFQGFLEHLVSSEAPYFLDVHWTPQVDLLRPDLINYSSISQIENLGEMSSRLLEHVGQGVPNPFHSHRSNESLIPYLPSLITERSSQLILSLYGRDFSAFGYAAHPPDAKEEFTNSQLNVALKAIHLIRGRHQKIQQLRTQALTWRLKEPLRTLKRGFSSKMSR